MSLILLNGIWHTYSLHFLWLPSLSQCPIQELKAERRCARETQIQNNFPRVSNLSPRRDLVILCRVMTPGGTAVLFWASTLISGWRLPKHRLAVYDLLPEGASILVAAIWMCSQIGSSCRMSEYSTGPTAVRKEQRVVKFLCFQTHPGFLFLPGSHKMRNRTSVFTFAFPPFWGHWCPPWKESSRPVPEKWPLLFLHLPVVSLNLSVCALIFYRGVISCQLWQLKWFLKWSFSLYV